MAGSNPETSTEELHQFMRRIYHDLKNPLNGIATLTEFIREELDGNINEETEEYMDMLVRRVQRAEAILASIRHYYRAGDVTEYELTDTKALVSTLFEKLTPPTQFELTFATEMPKFRTEREKLAQTFTHLLSNAIKFHDRPNGRVTVAAYDQEDFYQFHVIDDGPGIEMRYHERIFEFLETLQSRDEIEGSGAGLAIVKRVLAHRQGQITIQSNKGEGATFIFTWPKGILNT